MRNQFSSNTRKLNRIISKINVNNLNDSLYLTGSLENIEIPSAKSFQSNFRKNPFGAKIVNVNNLNDSLYTTASLENIQMPVTSSYQSQVKENPNPTKIVNNKVTINDFHTEILEYSARYTSRRIDEFNNIDNTLTIYNAALDYGTEGASSENFEILVNGLHLPGNYTIKEVGYTVVITFFDDFIDYDSVTTNDIEVFGKFIDIVLDTEDYFDILTENDENIII
jgi:hypothetical protein